MELIDNINRLLGDDLKQTLKPGARLKIAASCFSMYAFEALKAELEKIDELQFIFTSPTFTANEVTDKIRKERKEFHIPKADRERSLYGSEFEIQLRNKLTQRAIAKECADWMRRKATFKSNRSKAPMQQFACVQAAAAEAAYMPLHGFTAVDLGYQQGNAVSNLVNKMDEPTFTATYLSLFNQIWQDPEKLEDVTSQICDHIASVYQENSPESIYFLMLYNIFNEFLDDINEDVLPNDRTGFLVLVGVVVAEVVRLVDDDEVVIAPVDAVQGGAKRLAAGAAEVGMTKHVVVEPVAGKDVGLKVAVVVQPVVRQLLGA